MAWIPPLIGREATRYLVAQQFLTRLPTPHGIIYEPGGLAHAARYFPLVGLVVGCLSALTWMIFVPILPSALAAGLALSVLILTTGALHEDGFADCCDGLGGGASQERALDIMRDSQIGAYGGIGLILIIGVRWVALSGFDLSEGIAAFILAPVLGRSAMVVLLTFGTYARAEGAAKDVKDGVTRSELMITLAICALIALLCSGFIGLFVILAALIAAVLWLKWLNFRLGGYTGDGLGAVEQIAQVVTLLCLAAAWN